MFALDQSNLGRISRKPRRVRRRLRTSTIRSLVPHAGNVRRIRRGPGVRRSQDIMMVPNYGRSRWTVGELPNPVDWDMDNEGLGDLGFSIGKTIKKVKSKVKKSVKKVGKVVKKAAPYAVMAAGVVAAPYTGGASLAVTAGAAQMQQGKKASKAQKKAQKEEEKAQKKAQQQYDAQVAAQMAAEQAQSQVQTLWSSSASAQGQPTYQWEAEPVMTSGQAVGPAGNFSSGGGGGGFTMMSEGGVPESGAYPQAGGGFFEENQAMILTVGAVAIGGLLIFALSNRSSAPTAQTI